MEKYPSLLHAINIHPNASEFNTNHISSKELNLIIKLHKADYHPNWETIATTFNERSIDQIRAILSFFKKDNCIQDMLRNFRNEYKTLHRVTMFLYPNEHTKLMMTARDIRFDPK